MLSDLDEEETKTGGLLECLTPSLVYIETPLSTGSGIVIDDAYVVTNLHVVDPFTTAEVTLDTGKTLKNVPVKGADPTTDIAVLGPIKAERPAATFAEDLTLGKGDDVYLVGFPGEVDEEPEPAISRGILSRVRQAKRFDQTYLQTDAAIGQGQSGGALIDGSGRVVGISGLTFAEQFALALSSQDVEGSVETILAGEAPEYRGFPEEPRVSSGSMELDSPEDFQRLLLHSEEGSDVRLELQGDPRVWVSADGLDGQPLFATREAIEAAAAFLGVTPEEALQGVEAIPDFEIGEPTAPGVFEFSIPEETFAIITVGTLDPDGAEMSYTSSVPLVFFEDSDQDTPISVGDSVTGIVESLEVSDTYVLDLEEGDKIEIYVGSGPGDMGYFVQAPSEPLSETVLVDDSDVGLSGFDANDAFTADVAGRYRISVIQMDGFTTGYVLEITKVKGSGSSSTSRSLRRHSTTSTTTTTTAG